MQSLKVYVREHRLARGIKHQVELAKLSGLSSSTISRYEGNKRTPRIDELKLLADAMNMQVAELFSPPSRPSIDAMLANKSEETHQKARNLVLVYLGNDDGKGENQGA